MQPPECCGVLRAATNIGRMPRGCAPRRAQNSANQCDHVGRFLIGAGACAQCTSLDVLGRFLNRVNEDRQHANDVNVSFSPVHENTRLHTRDRTRGDSNRRGRREWHLEGGTQQWNQRAGGRPTLQVSCLGEEVWSARRRRRMTQNRGTSLWDVLRLLKLWARSGARSDRTSICLPSAASGQPCSMGESQWSKGGSGSHRRREVQI